jgi:WhiB family redox-sensing transcriptional regulator
MRVKPMIDYMDLSWQPLGNCYGLFFELGEDLWFPPENPGGPKEGKGVSGEKARVKAAKKICKDCPVKQECLEYAIAAECVGVWGGMDTNERRHYARRINAALYPIPSGSTPM